MRKGRTSGLIAATVTRSRTSLLQATALQAAAALVFLSPAAAQLSPNARPMGGAVVGGSASIGQTASATTINQASQRAAIDWRSFDVGSSQTVTFQQPNVSAVTLNRVTGPNPSQIAGRIQANGQVVLTNQSGVTFYKGAQVDTAGLVVSAAGITNRNFMAGKMVFDQAPKPGATISNAGTITIKQAGLAALVAPNVVNSGVISAKMGHVVLAGAETHTIDLYGDGLLSFDVTREVRQAPHGPDGKPVTALVTNTGTVIADGGTVLLTAKAADGIVQDLVHAGGRIQANTAGGRTGTVVVAGVGGDVLIDGRIAADGNAPGSTGGTVVANASGTVKVGSAAHITASGAAGGGTVAIGATLARAQGAAAAPDNTSGGVSIASGARIAANARQRGNGGRVAVLSTGTTVMNGHIAARGGAQGGNGGAVELSGATLAMATGVADTGAPAGQVGSILIDPTDVTISDQGGAGSVITPESLEAMTGNVTVQTDGSITAAASVTLTQRNQSLILDAGNAILVNAGVTLDATGGIELAAGAGGVNLLGNITARGAEGLIFNTTGAVTQGADSTITTQFITGTVGSAALTSRTNAIGALGSSTANGLTATTGDISIVTTGTLTLNAPPGTVAPGHGTIVPDGHTISITADTLAFASQGAPVLSAPGGTIALQPLTAGRGIEVTSSDPTAGTLSIPTGAIPLLQSATLSLGSSTAGPISLAPGSGGFDFGVDGFTRLQLISSGGITQNGWIAVDAVTGSAASLTLGDENNDIHNLGPFTATGDIFFHTGSPLTVDGALQGVNITLSSAPLPPETPITTLDVAPFVAMTLNANITGQHVIFDTTNGPDLSTAGALVQTGGVITANLLTVLAGSATLTQPNAIASVGNIDTFGDIALTTAGAMPLTGTLSAEEGMITLVAGGAITQTAVSSIQTFLLTGSAASASLTSTNNNIGTLSNFSTNAGGLAVTTQFDPNCECSRPGFALDGTISVPEGQTIAIVADAVAVNEGASVSAPNGTISFAPLTAGRDVELVENATEQSSDALSLVQTDLASLHTGTLQLGSATAGPILIGFGGNVVGDVLNLTGIASTLNLLSAGAITEGHNGTLIVPALTATADSLTLNGTNQIGTLGAVATTGALTFIDTSALSVAGPVSAGGATELYGGGGLTISGNITAPTLNLEAGGLGIVQSAGIIDVSGLLTISTDGSITQTGGSILASTLTGNASEVALTSTTNAIANLGPFSTPNDFTLTDGTSLTVVGAVDPNSVALNVTGDLLLNSSVTGDVVALGVTGAVTEGEGGSLSAGILRGSAGSLLLNQDNAVGTLADFTGTGGVTLVNSQALTVTGPVVDGVQITLTTLGPLTIAGDLTAPDVSLAATRSLRPAAAGTITQTGGVITAAAQLTLAAADAISQTGGTISTALLTGSAGGTASLTASGNQITTLGSFSSVGGFSLHDGETLAQTGTLTDTLQASLDIAGALALGGTVTAPTVSLATTGAVTQPGGSVTATTLTGATGAATLGQANTIAALGPFTAGGDFTLNDGASALTVTGAVDTGVNTLTLTAGSLAQTAAGTITAGTLAGSTTGAAILTADGNVIAALGPFTAGGAFVLNDGSTALTITGAVNTGTNTLSLTAGSLTQTAEGAITAGTLIGAIAGAADLGTATNAVAALGPFTAGGNLTLNDGATALAVAGAIDISVNTLTLTAGSLTQTADGTIAAGVLTGSTAGAATLTGPGNAITGLGPFTAGGDFALNDGAHALTVTGAVNAGANTLTLTTGSLADTAAGSITAGTLTGAIVGAANLGTAANAVAALGAFTTGGDFTLNDGATALTVTGAVAAGAHTVSLTAGSIADTEAGSITAGTLTGSTTGDANLAAATNAVAVLGPFTAGGVLALNDGATALTVAGPVAANTVSLTAGSLAETAGASITAGTLTGSTAGTATLAGANAIAALGPFTAGGAFSLNDGVTALTLTGPLNAGSNTVTFTAGSLTQTASGNITAGPLTGSTTGSTDLSGVMNAIADLGTFTSGGVFALRDGTVAIAGTVTVTGATPSLSLASDTIEIAEGASLRAVGGTVILGPTTPGAGLTLSSQTASAASSVVTADTLQLGNAITGPIVIDGAFDLTGVNMLRLVSGGAITETAGGAIIASALSGSAGSAALTGLNSIATLEGFTTTGGFALTDIRSLNVTGAVTAGTSAQFNVTGDLALAAAVTAPTVALDASGAVNEQGAGSIAATTLTGSAASAAFGALTNQVANLGPFQVSGDFLLADGRSLTVAGAIDPANVTLSTAGDLAINNTVAADTLTLQVTGAVTEGAQGSVIANTLRGTANSVQLNQANDVATLADFTSGGGFTLANQTALTVTGPVTDRTAITLSNAGPITVAGNLTAPDVTLTAMAGPPTEESVPAPGAITQTGGVIAAANTLTLTAADAVAQTGGQIVAGMLTGSSGGTTTLTQAANQIGTLGAYASTGGFILADSQDLTQTGTLSDTASIAVTTPATLTLTGTVNAPVVSLAAPTLSQTTGTIVAGTLNLNTTADTALTGQVAALGTVTSPGSVRLTDSAALTVAGIVQVSTLALTGEAMTFTGQTTAGTLSLSAASATQAGGTLSVGTLTGTTTGAMLFTQGSTAIGTLANVSAGGALAINDTVALTMSGTNQAPQINLTAPGMITLQAGSIRTNTLAVNVAGSGGRLVQTGTTAITPFGGGLAAVRLSVQQGSITLQNLAAPDAGLTLAMGGGTASGALDAASLLVNDQGGSAALTGTVAGQTGFAAAMVSQITRFDPAYTMNGCAIAAVSCVPITPVVTPPPTVLAVTPQSVLVPSTVRPDVAIASAASTLQPDLLIANLITLDITRSPNDPDFALPNVSDRDY